MRFVRGRDGVCGGAFWGAVAEDVAEEVFGWHFEGGLVGVWVV